MEWGEDGWHPVAKFADKDGSGEIDFAEMMLWLDKIAYDETGIYVPEK